MNELRNKRLLPGILILLIVCILFFQCKDEFQRLILVSTESIHEVTPITAKVDGKILDKGEGVSESG